MYADYSFYRGEYLGEAISEENFDRLSARASAYLDYATGGYSANNPDDRDVAMATCAVAEAWQTNDSGGEVVSESVGSWSRTFSSTNRTGNSRLLDAARIYLGPRLRTVEWA